jgi:hypothetical protein
MYNLRRRVDEALRLFFALAANFLEECVGDKGKSRTFAREDVRNCSRSTIDVSIMAFA